MKLKTKLFLINTITFTVIVILCGLFVYYYMKNSIIENRYQQINKSTKRIHDMVTTSLNSTILTSLRERAVAGHNIVKTYYNIVEKGKMNEQNAIKNITKRLLNQKIGESGYMAVVSGDKKSIVHPVIPYKTNLEGNPIISDIVNKKYGYIEYNLSSKEEAGREKLTYLTYFKPWDMIITATAYRDEFYKFIDYDLIKKKIESYKFGESGYIFITSSNGDIISHPQLKPGQNYLHIKDSEGKSFFKKMVQQKTGQIDYKWKSKESNQIKDKFIIFTYIPELEWIVASTAYTGELYTGIKRLKYGIIAAIFFAIISWSILSLLISSSIIRPIRNFVKIFSIGADGDLSVRSDEKGSFEIEQMTKYFNIFIAKLEHNIKLKETTERTLNEHKDLLEERFEESVAKLEATNVKLIKTSHIAGKAEVAAGVLHNIANVLNSIGISAETVKTRVKSFRTESLQKLAEMLKENDEDLEGFFRTNEKAKMMPRFLMVLSDHFTSEKANCSNLLKDLRKHIVHASEIIKIQQTYSKTSGEDELVSIDDIISNAIQINESAINKNNIELVVNSKGFAPAIVNSHKILQILVNLISNAQHAVSTETISTKKIVIKITELEEESIKVEVKDSGVGISEDNLSKIFDHGFTTKKNGHGFGLNSCRKIAESMNGTLSVSSSGDNLGATFTLRIPYIKQKNDEL